MNPVLRRTLWITCLLIAATLGAAARYQSPAPHMSESARALLASFDKEQTQVAQMAYADPKRLDWHFIPKAERKGLQLKQMTDAQKRLAHALLRSSLSQIGYEKATTIMDLESILNGLETRSGKKRFERDPRRYYFTIFGEPGKGRWGLSVEGHHLSLNFVVEGDRVISHTPAFFGANPARVLEDYGVGPVRGSQALELEENLAFDLVRSLDEAQLKVALIAEAAPADIRGAGEPQPSADAPVGLAAGKLTPAQQSLLRALIAAHAGNMPSEISAIRQKEIEDAGLEKVFFAWAGARQRGEGHYYRLQGPTFLVEYCNTQPDPAGNPANHPHAVWRDTRGDFGVHR